MMRLLAIYVAMMTAATVLGLGLAAIIERVTSSC